MQQKIEKLIIKSIAKLHNENVWKAFSVPDFTVERPKDFSHGDWMTNSAFVIAKILKKSPSDVANELCATMNAIGDKDIDYCVVEGHGFINITVTNTYLQSVVDEIIARGGDFGNNETMINAYINNEFISANPTGPLHLGNGRGGFLGDVLGRVLQKSGAHVTNEYYINDAGEQIITLGHSVLKDADAVYKGDYINALHKDLVQSAITDKKNPQAVGIWAAQEIVKKYIKKTTKEIMHISFDQWTSEQEDIIDAGFVEKAITILRKKNLAYDKNSATWLRTTTFGDDKDRVLIKSNGQHTYFASDCGYILNKMERGFTHIIEIWGADHHGYIARFKAAARALGFDGDMTFIIIQLVRLTKEGKEVRMSKRAGTVVYIDDLIAEVGHDATRFFFLMQSADAHMDFDIGLAKERSQKNPVYYVQYAHARLMSIIAKSKKQSFTREKVCQSSCTPLMHDKERELMRTLEIFQEVIIESAHTCQVHKLSQYAITLAEKFHSFYAQCRVIDEEQKELSYARLKLVYATQSVIAQTLHLIGVEAPDHM